MGSVDGRKVIVSAGSLGSTELLLACRDTHKSLPGLSAMVGKRWSGNGDFLLAGTFNVDRDIDPGSGPSITAGFDCSTETNKIFVQDRRVSRSFSVVSRGRSAASGALGADKAFSQDLYFPDTGIEQGLGVYRRDGQAFRGGHHDQVSTLPGYGNRRRRR